MAVLSSGTFGVRSPCKTGKHKPRSRAVNGKALQQEQSSQRAAAMNPSIASTRARATTTKALTAARLEQSKRGTTGRHCSAGGGRRSRNSAQKRPR
eukprot:5208354-Pleurochrysis_carterae.AAC.3